MFDTILAPVDFSPDSAASLREAARLARAANAKLLVLYAEPLEAPAYFSPGQLAREQPAYRDAKLTEIREFAAAAMGMEDAETEIRFADVEAAEAIQSAAAEAPRTLIVMGTHGRTGLKGLLYGSTTERIMTGGSAVLAVRAEEQTAGGLVALPSQEAAWLATTLGAGFVEAGEERGPAALLARAKAVNARFAFRPAATSVSA